MFAHPALTDDAVMFGSRSSSGGPRVGGSTPTAAVLFDEALATYIDWRDDERGVADAYARWCEAPGADEGLRFAAYAAALDQEEAAAEVYAESIGELERWLERHGARAVYHYDGPMPPHSEPHESSQREVTAREEQSP